MDDEHRIRLAQPLTGQKFVRDHTSRPDRKAMAACAGHELGCLSDSPPLAIGKGARIGRAAEQAEGQLPCEAGRDMLPDSGDPADDPDWKRCHSETPL